MSLIQNHQYVLFVDDDQDDQELLRNCCEEMDLASQVRFVDSGEAMFYFLSGLSATNLPSLIVLDLNMPGMNGEEILLLLKRDNRYRHIPVVFFSTGSRVQSKYIDLGAEAFYVKPFQYEDIQGRLRTFFQRLNRSTLQ